MGKLSHEGESRSEQSKEPIEISFGDVLISIYSASKQYLITDVGADNYCYVTYILDLDGKEALGISGTSYRKDIAYIKERWDLPRILQATMTYFGDQSQTGRIYKILNENAKQSPRLLSE